MGIANLASIDIIQAFKDNDAFGWACLVALMGLSVYSISVIFFKFTAIKRAARQTEEFERLVEKDGSWEKLFLATKELSESPLSRLLKETYVECRLENWFEERSNQGIEHRLEIAKCTVENVLQKTIASEESRLLAKLPTLSTISTLGPFIGLLGTVWGVLAAFQSLGAAGGASLEALAPGISTALLTTIFGLFCAIPALVAYNYMVTQVHAMTYRMEGFAHELENAVRKQILLGKSVG